MHYCFSNVRRSSYRKVSSNAHFEGKGEILTFTFLVSCREVFAQWQNTSGWVDGWSFFVGLLTPAYVLTGYGTVCYLCDEVENPEKAVPQAMVGSVIAASITGFFFVVPVSFVLPEDMTAILSSAAGQPIPSLFYLVTGSSGGAFGLLFTVSRHNGRLFITSTHRYLYRSSALACLPLLGLLQSHQEVFGLLAEMEAFLCREFGPEWINTTNCLYLL
jgi:hypothetical protein